MPKGTKGPVMTERLNMFISPEELKAIDDFRFEKRISSRSEAIRVLVDVGLEMAFLVKVAA